MQDQNSSISSLPDPESLSSISYSNSISSSSNTLRVYDRCLLKLLNCIFNSAIVNKTLLLL